MIVSDEQMVSLETHRGVPLTQFLPDETMNLEWTRERSATSTCSITVPTTPGMVDLLPWAHWVTVWDGDGQSVLWRGPFYNARKNRIATTISALDPSAHHRRTRTPLTKRWEAVDPCVPAAAMWEQLVEDKNLNIRPIVRPDPLGDRFDYALVRDAAMMEQDIADLVRLGLRWCVVGGVPILGPVSREPVAALTEEDFLGDGLELVRDGSQMYNDVVLRGADTIARARVDLPGQNLQTIVEIDDMFGASNADKAVRQFVRYTGAVRDTVEARDGTELHPEAPIRIEHLIPTARITVEAFGVVTLTEVRKVQVRVTPGRTSVSVGLDSVNDDLPELVELQQTGTRPS
ncbi:minor tail protein [Mycobacterium phage Megabear]|nr:minor tail protein [Mycobacterium phage Megabear]